MSISKRISSFMTHFIRHILGYQTRYAYLRVFKRILMVILIGIFNLYGFAEIRLVLYPKKCSDTRLDISQKRCISKHRCLNLTKTDVPLVFILIFNQITVIIGHLLIRIQKACTLQI